ncbi:MAG: winged helix-turn-helix transcriptional regulator [Alphaproteobacteria bacterium]|nr:winged helix-turn-helix transcriptional regulator [Alphaproteobacteria bacterium]
MVRYQQPLDRTFIALADPTRRAILARLSLGQATVGELAAPFAMSWPAVTKHLDVLEGARLIERERRGRERLCRLRPVALREADAWLEPFRQFWQDAFDNLARHLAQPSGATEESEHG